MTVHKCKWATITWGEISQPEADGDIWMIEQRGVCSCGRKVAERFYSDDALHDAETGESIDERGDQ